MADIRTRTSSLAGLDPSGDSGISSVNGTYTVFGDVLWSADHALGLGVAQQRSVRLSGNGTSTLLSQNTTIGITGSSVNGSTARVTVATDPEDAAKACWLCRVDSSDADTDGTGAKRCEVSMTGFTFLERETYVIGFVQRLADWTATTDEQLTWQTPAADALGVSPWAAHYVQGDTRRVDVRFNLNETPSNGTSTITTVWSESDWAPNQWDRFVIVVRESLTAGRLDVWKNGVLVGAYAGPVGYVQSTPGSYWKQGVYHWTNAGNTWDASVPMRDTWTKGAFISTGVTPEDMDEFLKTL